jgi:glycerate 2-kinase
MGETMKEQIDNSTDQRKKLLKYTEKILDSLSIENLIQNKIKFFGNSLTLEDKIYEISKNIYIFGFGKSSASMAQQIEKIFGDKILDGVVITKDGYEKKLDRIKVLSGSHPYPDERTFSNTDVLINKLKNVKKNSTVIFLISGGGSSLFEITEEGISIDELKEMNKVLLDSGLDIKQINVIRKHISAVKGGKLLKIIKEKNCDIFNMIISDVENNDLSTIASGPTNYDSSTFKDAVGIIKGKNLENKIPKSIMEFLEKNIGRKDKETLKEIEFKKYNIKNFFISKVEEAVLKAYNILSQDEKNVHILSSDLYGESFEMGNFIGSIALEIKKYDRPFKKPCLLITGGESTVTIKNKKGKGGPNKEFILGFVDRVKDVEGITQIAIDTDGTDGPCDSAGAVGDYRTYNKIKEMFEYNKVLKENNTEDLFKATKDLIITGPKESNLNDLRITLIE